MGGLFSRTSSWLAEIVDRRIGWARLPLPLGILVLIGLRNQLRRHNLYSTGRGPRDMPPRHDPNVANRLEAGNGTYNDLNDPLMGSLRSRFGRNVPPERTYPEKPAQLLDPSPRLISERLLRRDCFQPATTLNLLAAAWIQYEVHDWMSHPPTPDKDPWNIPLAPDDRWPHNPMTVDRTSPDPSPDPDGPPTFINNDTHWWDASQIYGDTLEFAEQLRSKQMGMLKTDEYGLPPKDVEDLLDVKEGVAGNFWVGLALLHSVFMKEHNAICEELNQQHPGAITLHNFPNGLRQFKKADGTTADLATIDVLRVRERGVPRYNQFRRLFRLKPATTFEELTDITEWAEELRQIYSDVERVDLMIGVYAEPKPKGFGFSDTAFRVFILMASRRLESDRFLTEYFRPDVYTPRRLRLGQEQHHEDSSPAALQRARPGARGCEQSIRPLDAGQPG